MPIEALTYMGLPNCLHLSNADADVVVTTAVGPRVLRYACKGQQNMLGEYPNKVTPTPLGDWKPYGGHRLWAAPESMNSTYAPDNTPIEHQAEGERTVHLRQPTDVSGLRKQMTVTLAEQGTGVTLVHSITNCNPWTVVLAPWTITIHTGGLAILPREPFCSHDDCLLPAQSITLWPFTDLQDPRFTLGPYLLTRPDAARSSPQKLGLCNKQGWCAYYRDRTLMLRQVPWDEHATYPDLGSNNETFVAGDYMEIELLGPLVELERDATVTITESWRLIPNVDLGPDAASIPAALEPHLR